MTRGVVTSTLVCAAFVYACAPRVGIDGGDTGGTPTEKRSATSAPASSDTGFTAVVDHALRGNTARLELIVTNHGEGVEVRFPSGMTHDFVVLDTAGREAWRASEGRFFTQSLQTRQLHTGRSLRYVAEWKNAEPGEYRIVATLHSDTHFQQTESRLVIR